MGLEYRDELVGKRFLCVSGPGKLKISKISEWNWRAGIIRAVDKNGGTTGSEAKTATVYVEFDGQEWQKREWLKIHDNTHHAFLVEKTIILAQRVDPYSSRHSTLHWPALNFEPLVDRVGVKDAKQQPVEFFVDKHLALAPRDGIKPFQENSTHQSVFNRYPDVKTEVDQWLHEQQVHDILMKAPYSLTGYRVQVYRRGSTTQWFSAVITGHDLYTRELVVMDDTVLESHTENPAHVQMMFLDDVVNSLLKGENVGITPRRRAVNNNPASQTTNPTSFSRSAVPRSHSPSHATTQQNQGTSKAKSEQTASAGSKKSKRSKLSDVPEQEEKDKKEKPEKETKEKPGKDKVNSHKSKKERKRKTDEKPVEETKKAQTPPKRPRSRSVSSDESQEQQQLREKEKREKEVSSGPPSLRTRAKTPDQKPVEEKKEEKKEKRHSSRHSDRHSDKQAHKSDKTDKTEEKKSKHHKHKSKKHSDDKHSTKDSESNETGEKSKHKSKHKHHKSDKKEKDKHKKEVSVVAAAAAAQAAATAAAATAAATAAVTAAAAAAKNPPVVSQQSEITPSPKVNSNSNATTSTAAVPSSSSAAATSTATATTVSQPMCTKPEPKHMPLLNTSSASETLLTQSLQQRRPHTIPSSVAVANIIRNTEATLERVIVNELKKKDSVLPPDNGKIRLSSDDNNTRNSTKSPAVEVPRRYPTVSTQGVQQVVPRTTAASIYTQPNSITTVGGASAITVSSAASFATATTTTTTLPSKAHSQPSSSSGSHWPPIHQNTIQVISRTSNAISPIVPGTKPPVVAVTGVVKSEDIKRTLPVSEGVDGHKPKEREKEISGILPRSEAVNIVAPVQDRGKNPDFIRDTRDLDFKSREHYSQDFDGKGEERPLASALREPIQVYRDPNLTDTEVIHVNSVQHQLAYQHHQRGGGRGDPSPTRPLSAAAAAAGVVTSQHSTLHPPSSLSAGIGANPSAFVPSAGRIPSHHPLARHPMFSPHVQAALYQHPLAGSGHIPAAAAYPAHLAVLNQHDLHSRQHLAGLVHQQESLARLHHPGAGMTFAQLQHAASTAAALQGIHPGMTAAQFQQLWQQQAAAGMPIPPTWIIQQQHEELERHLHQQAAQASEKSPSVAHAAVAPNQPHHEKPRTPHTPQPASASSRDLSATASRESSVRHYAEFPPSDAQAAVQRHFQESLRKLHLPYTFSTSPGSGSITHGTAIPKTESGQPKEVERQNKERLDAEERLRKEREDKELEWVRLQRDKQQHPQHREMDLRIQQEKASSMSHLERERYNKLHTSESQVRSREEALYRHHQADSHQRHMENERLRQLEKDRQIGAVAVKQEPGLDGRGNEHGYKMYQPVYYGNMHYDETRAGAVTRTEHGQQPPGQVKADSLIGYQPFRHAVSAGVQGDKVDHIKMENKMNPGLLSRTEPHRPVAVNAAVLAGKPRKDIPTPPPLIHRDASGKVTDPAAAQHASVIQGRERRDAVHPATTIALGAPGSQTGKHPQEAGLDHSRTHDNSHNVPVIVQHGIGNPPPLHTQMCVSPGSTNRVQHTSPGGGAGHLSAMQNKLQPLMTTAPSHSAAHQPVYTMSYNTSPTATTSTPHSLLLTALRPGEGGRTEPSNDGRGGELPPGKRKSTAVPPVNDPNRKKPKKSNELPTTQSSSMPQGGRLTYGDYYKSFVNDTRNSQFTGGTTAPEPLGRDPQGAKNQENVELRIEKVDQYKKGSMDPSAPQSGMLSTDSIAQHRLNNGALSDSDSTRSCSPKTTGSETSEGRAKTSSPNSRPGGHVNLKKKWLIRHSEDRQATTLPPPTSTTTKLSNSSTAADFKPGERAQDETRLAQSLPNGHLQQAMVFQHTKGQSSVTLADIPKSIPDHVYDFDNSSTCSDSSTTSHKSKKRGRESKSKRKHKHKRSHDKEHKEKHKGEKRACLDAEGTKALSKDKDTKMTDEGRLPAPGTQLQNLVDMMSPGGYKKKMIVTRARKDKDVLNVSRALVKPSIAKLKKTGEPFLQDGACCDVTPNLMKCRECRMKPSSKHAKINIFCRFYAFRRLRYSKNGNLTIAGFSEPDQCEQEDLSPWLPFTPDPADSKCLDQETSRYILEKVGDQFCQLVGQEEEAKSWNPSSGQSKIAWKRAVTGVREMCDTCDTTLFNIHWTCQKCGFVVCLDCYRTRKTGTAKVPKDKQSWLRCIKEQPHMPENLMLTQIIPGNALWDVGKLVHTLRAQLGIQSACKCKLSDKQQTPTNNDAQREKTPVVNGVSPTLVNETNSQVNKDHPDKDAKLTSFPTSNSSPLNLLADVASTQASDTIPEHTQQDSNKYSFDQQTLADTKAITLTTDTASESDPSSKSSTLRELLTKTAGKLGRPPSSVSGLDGSSFLTAFLPHKSENANKKQFGTMTSTFEDIIATVVEQNIASPAMRLDRTMQTGLHSSLGRNQCQQTMDISVISNNPSLKLDAGIVAPSVRHTLTETSVLYPDVPHSWLQDGRLLRLHDPQHKGNFRIFQAQWLRGEPVLVSSVHKTLNTDIWSPQWFSNKFGSLTNDLVNCLTGALIQGHEMKDFWDGFQDLSNRLVTKQGEPMSLKLKDWPPTEDFAEILPEHFQDLMHNLPLPEYTNRDGKLNLSSRLPDFFVKPDLGPKMYNAYGNCQYPELGTTNLHLDISDAVNVMVHVAIPRGDPEADVTQEDLEQEGIKIVDAACTDEQTRRRVRDDKEKAGALWHIFRAEDAEKIRELLREVARERGEDNPDDHDPIHDQSWYLDKALLDRLHKEHGVQGWAIAQCHGDAVFIPGGAPHQVQNLQSCIKVAEDFVSPEHITHCFNLTQEFRKLSDTHSNHEDKLQIKNMIYHAVKDAAGVLVSQVSQEVSSQNASS